MNSILCLFLLWRHIKWLNGLFSSYLDWMLFEFHFGPKLVQPLGDRRSVGIPIAVSLGRIKSFLSIDLDIKTLSKL